MFIVALLIIAKTWKPPKCPLTDGWMENVWWIYIYKGILLSRRKDAVPLTATWVDLEITVPSK